MPLEVMGLDAARAALRSAMLVEDELLSDDEGVRMRAEAGVLNRLLDYAADSDHVMRLVGLLRRVRDFRRARESRHVMAVNR
jgi:hypothetical protein